MADMILEFLPLVARNEEPEFGKYSQIPDAELEPAPRNQEVRAWVEQKDRSHVALHPNEGTKRLQISSRTLTSLIKKKKGM